MAIGWVILIAFCAFYLGFLCAALMASRRMTEEMDREFQAAWEKR